MNDWKPARKRAAVVLVSTALATCCGGPTSGDGQSARPTGGGAPPGWLRGTTEEQLRSVEEQLRGLDISMIEIGYRFEELSFAGRDRNWDYAKYQAGKVRLALELALKRRPKRAASARPFLENDLPALIQAIEAKDPERYQAAMERLRAGCMKCHVAESVPFFTVQFPQHRASPIRTE